MGGAAAAGTGVVRRIAREPMAVMSVLLLGTYVGTELIEHDVVQRERTFFGSYRVIDTADRRLLAHGTTFHGWQDLTGPLRRASRRRTTRGRGRSATSCRPTRTAACSTGRRFVGMGVGTLAAYGEPGRRLRLLRDRPGRGADRQDGLRLPAAVEGGRSTSRWATGGWRCATHRPRTYGLVVLDAFSSDAIPAHLLTEEAVREYRRVLRPGGLLAVHVTNRHLDLVPVVAAEARDLGMAALVRVDQAATAPASVSTWVVLARDPADLEPLQALAGCGCPPGRATACGRGPTTTRRWCEVLDVGWG